jgi:uncharacterized protein YraI
MVKTFYGIFIFVLMIVFGVLIISVSSAQADVFAQQPTVAIATVTGTPQGPYIRVNADNDSINVRSGPGTDYDIIGVMIAGQTATAFGRSAGGSWIQVSYPGVAAGVGWVYSPLVTLLGGGDIPILEQPPTSTPRITPTIDPTLASQFIVDTVPTKLPTFTAPPLLIVPTFEPPPDNRIGFGVPMGLIIVVFGIIGLLGAFVSLIRGR